MCGLPFRETANTDLQPLGNDDPTDETTTLFIALYAFVHALSHQ
jgi:hypothetical protein